MIKSLSAIVRRTAETLACLLLLLGIGFLFRAHLANAAGYVQRIYVVQLGIQSSPQIMGLGAISQDACTTVTGIVVPNAVAGDAGVVAVGNTASQLALQHGILGTAAGTMEDRICAPNAAYTGMGVSSPQTWTYTPIHNSYP